MTTTVIRLLTPQQLAEHLGITTEALSKMRLEPGKGPKFVKLGRDIRYRWPDVLEWLDANTRTSTKEES